MANSITTIQIHEDVKEELAQFKEKSSESYEEIIIKRTQQARTFISNYFSPMPMELKQTFLL